MTCFSQWDNSEYDTSQGLKVPCSLELTLSCCWELSATSCQARQKGHPLYGGSSGGQNGSGGQRCGGNQVGVLAAGGRHHDGGGGCGGLGAGTVVLP